MDNIETRKTYTVAQAADVLGITPGVIYRMHRLGQLPGTMRQNPYTTRRSELIIPQAAIDRVLADRAASASGQE